MAIGRSREANEVMLDDNPATLLERNAQYDPCRLNSDLHDVHTEESLAVDVAKDSSVYIVQSSSLLCRVSFRRFHESDVSIDHDHTDH